MQRLQSDKAVAGVGMALDQAATSHHQLCLPKVAAGVYLRAFAASHSGRSVRSAGCGACSAGAATATAGGFGCLAAFHACWLGPLVCSRMNKVPWDGTAVVQRHPATTCYVHHSDMNACHKSAQQRLGQRNIEVMTKSWAASFEQVNVDRQTDKDDVNTEVNL
jgi:hypothetical protein